jgi:isoquinoline 1-oxidoreductase beta subunit
VSYADLAEAAAELPVPEDPPLKEESAFSLIGKDLADVDSPAIVRGEQAFSLDFTLPNMLYAVVNRCPNGDGQPVSFDAAEAKTVRGVVDFHMLRTHHAAQLPQLRLRRGCAGN